MRHEEAFKKWLKALRSGKYSQTIGTLQNDQGFCCLGVACDVLIPENKQQLSSKGLMGKDPYSQPNAPVWLKNMDDDFKEKTGSYLVELNDTKKMTFNEIADCLQAVYIEKVL